MSQLQRRAGKNNFLQIHVSYTPLIGSEQSMYHYCSLGCLVWLLIHQQRLSRRKGQSAMSGVLDLGLTWYVLTSAVFYSSC